MTYLVPAVGDHLAASVEVEDTSGGGAVEEGSGGLHVGGEGQVGEAGSVQAGEPAVGIGSNVFMKP